MSTAAHFEALPVLAPPAPAAETSPLPAAPPFDALAEGTGEAVEMAEIGPMLHALRFVLALARRRRQVATPNEMDYA